MKKLLVLVAAVLVAGSVFASGVPDLTIKELKNLIAEHKAVIIDVNGTDFWKEGHIPGALDFESNSANLRKVLPSDKNTLIVAYCGGPQCTAYKQAVKAVEKLGYKNVKHLSAGISGWKDAGEKMEKGS